MLPLHPPGVLVVPGWVHVRANIDLDAISIIDVTVMSNVDVASKSSIDVSDIYIVGGVVISMLDSADIIGLVVG